MKIVEILNKPINECATSGATSAGAIATAMPGNGAGFGNSIFMQRNTPKTKKRKAK